MYSMAVLILTSCGIVLIIIVLAILFFLLKSPPKNKKPKEKFCSAQISQHQPHPQRIQKPPPDSSTVCTLPDRQHVTCGYASRKQNLGDLNVENDSLPELNLCNKSPVTLDIYHRRSGTQKFVFSGTIPTMQSLYVYQDEDGNSFKLGDELFATKHGDTKILYLPVILEAKKDQILWGISSSQTDESISIINLLSEIGHIKFRNYSYASYKLYYYGEYLGELKPFNKEEDIYFELYVGRSSQGFRLGSQVSLVMDGTNIVQNIALTNHRMTTLNVGLATSQPNFSEVSKKK